MSSEEKEKSAGGPRQRPVPPAGGAGGGGNANVVNLSDVDYEYYRQHGQIDEHTVYVISNESNQ